jgi:oligopeptide transport system permease protein
MKSSMANYIIKRIILMILTLFIILTICFVLIKLLPDPVTVPESSSAYKHIMAYREAHGYDKPIIVQYGIFLKSVFTKWDWGIGMNMYVDKSVTKIFNQKIPFTLLVNLYSEIISVPLGILLGIYAALKKNRWQDQVISVGVMIFVSVPSYVYAFIVQYLFGYKWPIFPLQLDAGYKLFSASMLKSMVMPVIALSFGEIAGLTRYTRAELTECLTSESMLLARTKGLTRGQATVRHALKNAMVPIFPMLLGSFISILSGSFIIEQIFGIPGVGSLYIDSITRRDYNFFMMLTAFYTAIGLAGGIVIDLSYGFIDPRIRMGAK